MLQDELATGDDEMMDVLFEARARFTASRDARGARPWVCLVLSIGLSDFFCIC